ncbi:hypothetical protein VNO77_24095 [Canavalia gladiata]|uniref:Uncharacterized protein n=1 Tax=Canavalia gladiata TaxID=3824 RepID=A0AAN9QFW9_CANGL
MATPVKRCVKNHTHMFQDMDKALVIWIFMLFNILTYSADGNTHTAEIGDFRTSKQQKEPKPMCGMIMESSKPCIQRTFPELHAVQRTTVPRLLKATTYRGPTNSRTRNVRNASSSHSNKPSSPFMAALKHLLIGLLLVPCFF